MPIKLSTIRYNASNLRKSASSPARTISEAKAKGLQTAFLCHSHKDKDLVLGVKNLLLDSGWQVYVDWADSSLPDTPDSETAFKIKHKINDLNLFLFLATHNSVTSRWCPWEIGYADGKKPWDNIIIIPTEDDFGKWHGSEYLQLYKKLDEAQSGGLAVWRPGQHNNGTWVKDL